MKRALDIIVSLIAIILFSIPMLIVSIGIRIDMGSPVTFQQKRPGLYGKPFYIKKFRTMTNKRDKHGDLLPDMDRMTKIGKTVRKLSLDELPQLFNVLRGELSLVGPRPLLMEYLELYTPEQARRHNVKPGMTGWAQVNGRNALTWEKKFELDVWYVDNRSFLLDIKILFMTVMKVIQSDGVNKKKEETMEKFKGTKK